MANLRNTAYLLKPDCEAVRKRHRDFWQHKTQNGPLLYLKAKKQATYPLLALEEGKNRKDFEQDAAWHINYCRSQVLGYEFLFDAMPMASVMFGRDITNMGVLCGEDFAIHPVTEFITFQENTAFVFENTPIFNAETPFVKKVLQIYKAVVGDIGFQACVNPPTTADALTTMSMVMGTDVFLRSLRKYPAAVQEKSMALNKLFYSFYNYLYTYLKDCGYGEAASWFPVFAEGKFDSVRCDVSVMLSEKMFMEFSVPALEDACSYLDYSMFNLDSVSLLRFLEPLAGIKNLNGIYWNIEPWLYNVGEYLPLLKKIREMGLLLALPCRTVQDAQLVMNKLGKSGLLLEFPVFENKEKALQAGHAVKCMAEHCLY